MNNRQFFLQWVRATWAGWVLGVPFVVALALIGEALGVGGAQVFVGAGIGAGVGLMQGRAIRNVIPQFGPWFWSCVGGVTAPFLASDIAKFVGWSSAYSLYTCVALAGLIIGTWQALLLRPRFYNTTWWVIASTLGWTLAGGTAAAADSLSHSLHFRGIWGALAYLGIIAGGGLILGLVTGMTLVRGLRYDPAV